MITFTTIIIPVVTNWFRNIINSSSKICLIWKHQFFYSSHCSCNWLMQTTLPSFFLHLKFSILLWLLLISSDKKSNSHSTSLLSKKIYVLSSIALADLQHHYPSYSMPQPATAIVASAILFTWQFNDIDDDSHFFHYFLFDEIGKLSSISSSPIQG
mgnify:CR=1 FL=1